MIQQQLTLLADATLRIIQPVQTFVCKIFDTLLFVIPDKEHQCITMPDIDFNSKAFTNYLMFTLSSLVIMFIDTIGSSCVIIQCFIRMCLMSCYNFVSSICQMITFLPTCCIFFLTSKLNCFCSTTNICKGNNNSICIVITALILIWLLYFGGLAYILKIAGVIKSSSTTITATTNASTNELLAPTPLDDASSDADSPSYSNQSRHLLREGPFINLNFPLELSKGAKGPFPDLDLPYLTQPSHQIVHAESHASVRETWPGIRLSRPTHKLRFVHTPRLESKPSKTTAADISVYEFLENFQDLLSQAFASTRNYAKLPSPKKEQSYTSKSPTVHTFLHSMLSTNSHGDTYKTLPLLTSSFITRPKPNGTETIHRDMFRRYWQQGRFCG